MINNKVRKTAKWLLAMYKKIDQTLSDCNREKLIVEEIPKAIVNTVNVSKERAVNINQFRENLLDSLYFLNDYIYCEFIRPDATGANRIRARFDIDEYADENGVTDRVRVTYGYGICSKIYTINLKDVFNE